MAEQTLLEIVQDVCRRQGLVVPTSVVGSTDQTVLQMWGLMNEEVEEHTFREFTFPQFLSTTTFSYTTDPDYNAFDFTTLPGFRWVVSNTLWNTSVNLPVAGPVTARDWVAMIALSASMAQDAFRVAGDWLQLYPGHTAANNYTFQWYSDYGVLSSTAVPQRVFLADTDTPRLPSSIMKLGLRYRWRREKGQPYAEEMRTYEKALMELGHRGPIPGDLSMDNVPVNERVAAPGLLIAAGSWPL